MQALGHTMAAMPTTITRGKRVVQQIPASRPAIRVVVGKVCKRCNMGWMEALDSSVDAEMLGLARGELTLQGLDGSARFRLARWILKTTCVLRHATPDGYRHIPQGIMSSCEQPKFLPRGFIAFAMQLEPAAKGLLASSMDIWEGHSRQRSTVEFLPQAQRTKSAFQYDQLLIGCSWVTTYGRPCFQGFPGFHTPIFLNDATYEPLLADEMAVIGPAADVMGNRAEAIQVALTCEIRQF